MNKKIDLLLGTLGSVLAGILFAICYNAFMGKFMIGYSTVSAIIAGGIFGALIGTPIADLALNQSDKIWKTAFLLGFACNALLIGLGLPVPTAIAAGMLFGAAFGCLAYVMDGFFWRSSLSYFLFMGMLSGVGLFLANTALGTNAGFSWRGVIMLGLNGLVCAVGAYVPVKTADNYRAASLKDLF